MSLADLIVLGGCAAIETAARPPLADRSGRALHPGRTDASQEDTDADSFQWLEPTADGFRNYAPGTGEVPTEHLLVDKAFMLNLSAPEMTALVGGCVSATTSATRLRSVRTDRPGKLTNDFFVNLLDMTTKVTDR
ncbi:MAG: peroxidase family protein [Microthrixaceae bacterium]